MKYICSILLLNVVCGMLAGEVPAQKLVRIKAYKAAHEQLGIEVPDHIVLPLQGTTQPTLFCMEAHGNYCLYNVDEDYIADTGNVPFNIDDEQGYTASATITSPESSKKLIVGLTAKNKAQQKGKILIYNVQSKKIEHQTSSCNIFSLLPLPDGNFCANAEVPLESPNSRCAEKYTVQGVCLESRTEQGIEPKNLLFTFATKQSPERPYLVATCQDQGSEYEVIKVVDLQLNQDACAISYPSCLKPHQYHVSTTHDGDIVVSSKNEALMAVFSIANKGKELETHRTNLYPSYGKLIPIQDQSYVSLAAGYVHRWQEQPEEKDDDVHV